VSTLAWIIVAGVAMSAVALVGGVTLLLPERTLKRVLMPLVALAAGSLLGGAMFYMVPTAIDHLGNDLSVYLAIVVGFVAFFILEQFLHWHHCHRPLSEHEPLGYLILIADGLHNFIGGLAVGAAFLVDIKLGVITWLVAAAHEIPQELGDFGILVHSGWPPKRALAYNVISAGTFLLGGLIAYAMSGAVDVELFVPFAAGNFIYIASADLLPQITSTTGSEYEDKRRFPTRDRVEQSAAFVVGLLVLLAVATIT